MLRNVIRCLLAAAVIAASSGCATVSLVDSWRDPGFTSRRYAKFLVVSVTGKVQRRQVFEDILAADLREQGVAAVASHTLTESKGKASQDEILEAVRRSGADAILTSRLVRLIKYVQAYPGIPPAGCYYPGYYGAYPYPYDFYGYYSCAVPYEPAEIRAVEEAVVETNLYDAATNRMIWSGTTSSYDSPSPQTDASEVSWIIVRELRREGFI
jgi:hypothetical protein